MPLFSLLLVAALAIFVLGNVWRVVRLARMPAHLRWELYPIPKGPSNRQSYGGSYFEEPNWWRRSTEAGHHGSIVFMLKEVFFLRGVFENFRTLWVWSLLLHWGLYLYLTSTVIASAALMIGAQDALERSLPFIYLMPVAYGTACILGAIGSVGLIATRIFHPRLKGFTTRTTIFNLCLLGSIFGTGLVVLFLSDQSFANVLRDIVDRRFASNVHWSVAHLHFGLVGFFLAYFPFTPMTHMYMKYFTWHSVRWDDRPARFDQHQQNAVAQNLARRVSWQALHIKSSEPQSWADVASRCGPQPERHG